MRTSVADPDPDSNRRLDPDPDSVSGSGSSKAIFCNSAEGGILCGSDFKLFDSTEFGILKGLLHEIFRDIFRPECKGLGLKMNRS